MSIDGFTFRAQLSHLKLLSWLKQLSPTAFQLLHSLANFRELAFKIKLFRNNSKIRIARFCKNETFVNSFLSPKL